MVSEGVAIEQMLSRGTPERAAADDHNIERSGVGAPGGTPQRFVQPVANITPDHVLAEVRVLSSRTRHKRPPISSTQRFRQVDFKGRMRVVAFLPEARRGQSQHRTPGSTAEMHRSLAQAI